jgi:hypothetical protein
VRFWDLLTGLCNAVYQTPAKGTCRRDIRLIDNKWTLVWHMDEQFHIWAIEEGEFLQRVDMAEAEVKALQISGDGSTVFYISQSSLKALHLWTGEIVGNVGFTVLIVQPFLFVDGLRVWMRRVGEACGWDFGIPGSPSINVDVTPLNRPHLDFVGGVRQTRISLPPIEDTMTGKEFLRLPDSLRHPNDAQWDGQYLVAGYEEGDVLILKCNCMLSH